jgi:peptidoglycan hydrolase CwlO-like protein
MARELKLADLEPLDRLEEKVKLLVAQVNKTRTEQEESKKENTRLQADLERLKALEAESSSNGNEIKTLLAERETIRTRVTDILARLKTLDL